MGNQTLFQRFWGKQDEFTDCDNQRVYRAADDDFNCIAWSIGYEGGDGHMWLFSENGDWDWGADPKEEWNRFIAFYRALGYRTVKMNETFDPSRHYVALIGEEGVFQSHDVPQATHAIRYDPGVGWTSKNGGNIITVGDTPFEVCNLRADGEYYNYGHLEHLMVAPKQWNGHYFKAHGHSDYPF